VIAMTGVFTNHKDSQDIMAAAAEVLKTIPETRFYRPNQFAGCAAGENNRSSASE
jgi:hypothetical protein